MKPKIDIKTQNDFINEVLEEWAKQTERALREAIKKKKLRVPEETIENLQYQLLKATSSTVAGAIFSFQDSGRHVDMRIIEHKNRPIELGNHFILNWMKKRGKGKFRKGVPGYRENPKNISEDKQLERIANAIVAAMANGKTKSRRRGKWFNKTFYKWVNNLVEALIQQQSQYVLDATKFQVEEIFKQK